MTPRGEDSMTLHTTRRESRGTPIRVGMIGTYPPRRCGIASFTHSLVSALGRQPEVAVGVVGLIEPGDSPSISRPEVITEIDPSSRHGIASASARLNGADVVIVQHEFGIYGADDGASVIDLVSQLHCPVVVVLHTVLTDPTPGQRAVIEGLARAADGFVALSRAARDRLITHYRVEPSRVVVVPHGSSWTVQPPQVPPRRRLLTWGLLGPGKGIERAIDAIATLDLPGPPVTYRVAGQIHPMVLARYGDSYMQHLERRIAAGGLGNQVVFDNRYQDDDDLLRVVAAADVVILPYDNSQQVSSGVLTEAISAGRPVVATAFPHAIEMLDGGAGIVVDHDDRTAMSQAIASLLTDELAYRRAADAAAAIGADLGWDAIARRFTELLAPLADRSRGIA